MSEPRNRRASRRNAASWALFALAAIILVVAGVIYVRDQDEESGMAPIPTAGPGRNELINVVRALQAEGIEATIAAQSVRSEELDQAGQEVVADGVPLYVFIYRGADAVAQRERDFAGLDPAAFVLTSTSGTPVAGEGFRLFGGSNVIAALKGGDADLQAKVERAIDGLP